MENKLTISEEQIAIASFRPLPGKEAALLLLLKEHYSRLKKQGLVTDRKPLILHAGDGSLIEIFGWRSEQAIRDAHENPHVLKMWDEFEQLCTYIPLAELEECQNMFATFQPG